MLLEFFFTFIASFIGMLLDFFFTFLVWFIGMYAVCLLMIYFIFKDLLKLKKEREEQDIYFDAISQASFGEDFYDAASSSGASSYGTGRGCETEPGMRTSYPEDLMEEFLESCLEEIDFVCIEYWQWVSATLAPDNEEQVVEDEATHEVKPPQKKISFKKRLKNFFCCCCISGEKD